MFTPINTDIYYFCIYDQFSIHKTRISNNIRHDMFLPKQTLTIFRFFFNIRLFVVFKKKRKHLINLQKSTNLITIVLVVLINMDASVYIS